MEQPDPVTGTYRRTAARQYGDFAPDASVMTLAAAKAFLQQLLTQAAIRYAELYIVVREGPETNQFFTKFGGFPPRYVPLASVYGWQEWPSIANTLLLELAAPLEAVYFDESAPLNLASLQAAWLSTANDSAGRLALIQSTFPGINMSSYESDVNIALANIPPPYTGYLKGQSMTSTNVNSIRPRPCVQGVE